MVNPQFTHEPRRRLPSASRTMLLVLIGGLVALLAAVLVFLVLSARGRDAGLEAPVVAPAIETQDATAPRLTIHITPPGATLAIDGEKQPQPVGSDGLTVEVAPGQRVLLRAELSGHEPQETSVTAPASGTAHVHLSLLEARAAVSPPSAPAPAVADSARGAAERPRRTARRRSRASARAARMAGRPGALVISYEPASATLIVDGVRSPGRSPLSLQGMDPGRHTIALKAPGYETARQVVDLRPGERRAVAIRLLARTGTVDIVSRPDGGQIKVNGELRGRGRVQGLSLAIKRPHRIVVTLPGYQPWSKTVTLSPGRNPTIVATLVASGEPAPTAQKAPVPARTRRTRDITVPKAMTGDAGAGGALFSARCGGNCHGGSAPALSPRRYTKAQWARYFASRRHARRALLREHFTQAELADVKAYLMSKAADVAGAGAGIR